MDEVFFYGLFPLIRERWNGNTNSKWIGFQLGSWAALFEDK